MAIITFSVCNDVPGTTTNHVLVFLKPVEAKDNYQYYAWQDLNPSNGASIPFSYNIDISAIVIEPHTGSRSAKASINPGQCFSATNPNGQTPIIEQKDVDSVTAQQAGIRNDCNTPVTKIAVEWSNKNQKVVTVGLTPPDIINIGKTVTFELEPSLYFMAADPTQIGPNFKLQVFSQATKYQLDPSVSTVDVRWYRDSIEGIDKFDFSPPSRGNLAALYLAVKEVIKPGNFISIEGQEEVKISNQTKTKGSFKIKDPTGLEPDYDIDPETSRNFQLPLGTNKITNSGSVDLNVESV